MRQIALIACTACLLNYQTPRITPAQARSVIDFILMYRHLVLADDTLIDFCAIPEFWNQKGQFIGDAPALKYARFQTRTQCSNDSSTRKDMEPRTVTIDDITISGDTVTAHSTTKRGNTSFLEMYLLLGGKKFEVSPIEYRVVGITQG